MSIIVEAAPARPPSDTQRLKTAAALVLDWVIAFSLITAILIGMALILTGTV